MPNRPRPSKRLLLCGGVLALALAACSPTLDQRGNLPDPQKLAEIKPGVTTKDEVTKLLGTPSAVGTFDSKTWYYISRRTEQTAFFRPEVLDQKVFVIAFDDKGIVRDVHERKLADAREVTPSDRVTPSSGRELGLLEQLLGNVGRFNSPTSPTIGPYGQRN